MTKQKHLKERVRARMAKTGESYAAARRRVVSTRPEADDKTSGYILRGGTHPDTSALANTLANAGVTADGKQLSEELILGIGGGLGTGYILWQFTGRHPIVTLGFRNQWQYPDRWLVKTCSRLGIEATLSETSGHVTALRTLREALSKDGPRPLVWIDAQEIGYWHFPERLSGMGGYPVVVTEERDGRFFIDDRNSAQRDELAEGVQRVDVRGPADHVRSRQQDLTTRSSTANQAENAAVPAMAWQLPHPRCIKMTLPA
jgi:hypothetical protein